MIIGQTIHKAQTERGITHLHMFDAAIYFIVFLRIELVASDILFCLFFLVVVAHIAYSGEVMAF